MEKLWRSFFYHSQFQNNDSSDANDEWQIEFAAINHWNRTNQY